MVGSEGGVRRVAPSRRSASGLSPRAHWAMAVKLRAPATAAHTARATTVRTGWRTPRRCRGSGTVCSRSSRPPAPASGRRLASSIAAVLLGRRGPGGGNGAVRAATAFGRSGRTHTVLGCPWAT